MSSLAVRPGLELVEQLTSISRKEVQALKASGLFDEDWYVEQYPDVRLLGMDAAEHYLWVGAKIGRRPSGAAAIDGEFQGARRAGNPALQATRAASTAVIAGTTNDLHSSTYHQRRPYRFLPAGVLDELAERYISGRDGVRSTAVFTAITGAYDNQSHHEYLSPHVDYHLFMDAVAHPYVNIVHGLPYYDDDLVRRARFVKTHAHLLFAGYEVAIWVDGNVLIRDDIWPLVEQFIASGHPVGAIPHPLRNSVFEEAAECIKRGKDSPTVIEAQMARYREQGFDCDDLIESNFMMFRIGHPQLRPLLAGWWAEIERGSCRDQLSFNYALQRAGAQYFPLMKKPNSVRNSPQLALFHHGSNRPEAEPSVELAAPPERRYAEVRAQRVAAQQDRSADVIICVHNALEVTSECLKSVAANRDAARHRIILVNDGSDEATTEWLGAFAAAHERVTLVHHAEARGYTKAANAGLRLSDADLSIMLNSDTLVAGAWIDKMLDAVQAVPTAGIVGPLSSAASHQSIPESRSSHNQTAVNDMPPGYDVARLNAWCEEQSPADFLPLVPLVHGFCFGLTRELIESVGLFDEAHFPFGYGEENDYCLRAVDAGFALVVATHTYVYHHKSQSYSNSTRRTELMRAGNQKIRDLHGDARVVRAIHAMQNNPHLVRMRRLAAGLYEAPGRPS